MTAYEFPELTDEAARYWLKMDTWKPYDAAWLLCGIDPHGMEIRYGAFATELCTQMCGDHPISKAAFQVVELLKASSKAGSISFPAAPSAAIAWARSKSLSLPSQFLDAGIDGARKGTPASIVAGGTTAETPQGRRAAAAIKARGIKRDILENWEAIASQYGPDADAAQVARFFGMHLDASRPKPKRKTYHNRLGELRAAGLIP